MSDGPPLGESGVIECDSAIHTPKEKLLVRPDSQRAEDMNEARDILHGTRDLNDRQMLQRYQIDRPRGRNRAAMLTLKISVLVLQC